MGLVFNELLNPIAIGREIHVGLPRAEPCITFLPNCGAEMLKLLLPLLASKIIQNQHMREAMN